jgi:hypothetical protein
VYEVVRERPHPAVRAADPEAGGTVLDTVARRLGWRYVPVCAWCTDALIVRTDHCQPA